MTQSHPLDGLKIAILVDDLFEQATPDDYDGLVLPGGVVNADALRMVDAARRFAKDFDRAGKPIAVVCHGPWLLISAGLAAGRTLTSWPSLQDDLRNAGANWVDREVISDGNWTSSRKPDDLPAFNREFIATLRRAPAKRAMAMPIAD